MLSGERSTSQIQWNHAVYMQGKLTDVVHHLVAGPGDARSRLREATPHLLALVPGMFPETEGIRARVEHALQTLTKYHDPAEYSGRPATWPGSIFDDTLNRIRNSTASTVAEDLFGAWIDLGAVLDQHWAESLQDAEWNGGEVIFAEDVAQIPTGLDSSSVVIFDDIPRGDS